MAAFSHSLRDGRDSVLSNGSSMIPHDAEIIEIDDDSDGEVQDKEVPMNEDDEEISEGDEDDEEDEIEEEEDYDEDEDREMRFENGEEDEAEEEESVRDSHENEEEAEELPSEYGGTNGTHSIEEPYPNWKARIEGHTSRSPAFTPSNLLSSDIKQALHPLQDMAERVLKQIESFAHNLDQFRRQSPTPHEPRAFREACKLVKTYQSIAENNARDLSKADRSQKPKRSTQEEKESENVADEVEEQIARWQREAETWDLLSQLLLIADPETRERAEQCQETALQSLHRYSSDQEVWENFLETDLFARECVIVLQWLEKTARSANGRDSVVSELDKDTDRDQGLWAHGWLYTKETIKGAKRLRSWPQPLDPEDSRVTSSLLGSERQAPLITQLDPDAIIRQGLGLQKQDQVHEQAAWLTCWKMLRSGRSWSEIRAWSQERLESWRAISVFGASLHPNSKSTSLPDTGLSRMMSCRSQQSWKSACSVLASDPHVDRYERAVYALLCGETKPAYAVCQSWDDFLYVFYNHMVLSRYSDFCKQFLRKLGLPSNTKVLVNIEPPNHDGIRYFLSNIRKDERFAEESKNFYRQIQAAILSQNYDYFFYNHAIAKSKYVEHINGPSLLPLQPPPGMTQDPLLTAPDNESSLRIIAHLYLLLSFVGIFRVESHLLDQYGLNVIKYVEVLREKDKMDLIPLYASLLPETMGQATLGIVLINVLGEGERQVLLQRMRAFGINVSGVLSCQWQWALAGTDIDVKKPIKIAGKFVTEQKPGSISALNKDIIGRDVPLRHERLIRCMEWYRFVGTEWPTLCVNIAYLYKRFLRRTQLATARELWKRIQFSQIPVPPEFNLIALKVDANADSHINQSADNRPASPVKAGRSKSPLKSAAYHRQRLSSMSSGKTVAEQLCIHARTVEDLELLISTLDAMERWGNLSDEYLELSNPERKREFQQMLQQAIDDVTENVNPLCQDWLCRPLNEEEAAEFDLIRTAYLPEIILMYHNSLYLAGCTIGREILAQCMSLSIAIAGSQTLTECFVSAGRMRELVRALAMSSMAIMTLKDPKLKKKLPRNATLDIWKIKPIEEDAVGLTQHWKKG
ncbi:conserved hypothetical protein [Coccidioides posadasii str. Silveira]|uniref:Nuclear pore complex protein n=2 Tax=Coccidioides posadasii (strain RMSCC 757 / Silveira) TaxID=443226 RepID=E9DID2_COCPS|nr:conserved hypothetical protein [Coccidioides posadasii str. Silveira]